MSFVSSFEPREPEENYFEWLADRAFFDAWDEFADDPRDVFEHVLLSLAAQASEQVGAFLPSPRSGGVPPVRSEREGAA